MTLSQRGINVKKKKKYKRRKGKKSRFKAFVLKLIVITVLLTTALVLIARTSYFKITSIQVFGNSRYENSEIIKTTAIKKGANGFITMGINPFDILRLSYGSAEKALLSKYPYMKDVNVRFSLPNKVKIMVTERDPAYIIVLNGKKVVADEEMCALDYSKAADEGKVPMLLGIKAGKYKFGDVLSVSNKVACDSLKLLTDTIKNNDSDDKLKIFRLIKAFDLGDTKNVKITLKPDITVNFGDLSDLDYRITYLKQIYGKYIESSGSGYLDFSSGENPVFQAK